MSGIVITEPVRRRWHFERRQPYGLNRDRWTPEHVRTVLHRWAERLISRQSRDMGLCVQWPPDIGIRYEPDRMIWAIDMFLYVAGVPNSPGQVFRIPALDVFTVPMRPGA